jgi:hypothetical protein
VEALRRALRTYCPEIHHSDQGVQYAAAAYTAELQARSIQISMAEVGQAWQNGYAERLIGTIKDEEVDLSDYADYHDASKQLGRLLDEVYMHKRIHSSLGYLGTGSGLWVNAVQLEKFSHRQAFGDNAKGHGWHLLGCEVNAHEIVHQPVNIQPTLQAFVFLHTYWLSVGSMPSDVAGLR